MEPDEFEEPGAVTLDPPVDEPPGLTLAGLLVRARGKKVVARPAEDELDEAALGDGVATDPGVDRGRLGVETLPADGRFNVGPLDLAGAGEASLRAALGAIRLGR
jgi:hypothetical protein